MACARCSTPRLGSTLATILAAGGADDLDHMRRAGRRPYGHDARRETQQIHRDHEPERPQDPRRAPLVGEVGARWERRLGRHGPEDERPLGEKRAPGAGDRHALDPHLAPSARRPPAARPPGRRSPRPPGRAELGPGIQRCSPGPWTCRAEARLRADRDRAIQRSTSPTPPSAGASTRSRPTRSPGSPTASSQSTSPSSGSDPGRRATAPPPAARIQPPAERRASRVPPRA